MRMISIWKSTLAVAALLSILFPLLSEAGPMGKAGPTRKASPLIHQECLGVTKRPLSDFLNSQGTLNNPPLYFPPVKDYVGWADAVAPGADLPTTFALVDYAGLANQYIKAQTGRSLGTEVRGYVLECRLASGKAQITVALFTTNALGFAQSVAVLAENGFDFLNTPTIFGAKAQDVVKRAKTAAGPVTLFTTFTISNPDAKLPDFLDVALSNPTKYGPAKFSFASTTFGKCAYNGRLARLDVHQNASTDDQADDQGLWKWKVYSTEKVELLDSSGGDCLPE